MPLKVSISSVEWCFFTRYGRKVDFSRLFSIECKKKVLRCILRVFYPEQALQAQNTCSGKIQFQKWYLIQFKELFSFSEVEFKSYLTGINPFAVNMMNLLENISFK